MMRRSFALVAFALAAAAPLGAQMKDHDPDKKVAGGGLPGGWMSRTDRPTAKIEDVKFTAAGGAYHVTSGPAAIYWKESDKVNGPFTATATFNQLKAPSHPEAYGIFYAGSRLDAPEQSYVYVLVRGDGKVMVKHRAGADVHTLMDWTDNAAVHKADASGKASNTVTVRATADSTHLLVNGVQVKAIAGSYADAGGQVGLRINHNLDVEVASFSVKRDAVGAKGKPAAKKSAKKVG